MSLDIKVIGEIILAERIQEVEPEKKNGLIIPNEKPKQHVMKAAAVGETDKVKVGDKILMRGPAYHHVTFKDKEYAIVQVTDVVGVLL